MVNITRHPLLEQAYNVCIAIEECGASVPLTNAVTKASALLQALDKALPENTAAMTFGNAIESLKRGERVSRAGWNGKGMFLVYVSGSDVAPYHGTPYHDERIIDEDGRVTINPHIDMKTATGEMQPGWLASQSDMLADDWQVVS